MRWFYQANFCAECGNRLAARRKNIILLWWESRYFCPECAVRRGWHLPQTLAVCALGILVIGVALHFRRSESLVDRTASPVPAISPVVSAHDATAQLKPAQPAEAEAARFCGARTKRGTPCRHRVRGNQRCAQHRGQPSMLTGADSQSETPAPRTP
jgi:hypothetical protein